MTLNELSQAAWDGAEAQGLHANLDGVIELGAREQALLALIPLTLKLNTLVQHIKRHGTSLPVWDAIFPLETELVHLIEDTFDTLLDLCGEAVPPLPVVPGYRAEATAIRTLLVGTEVAEALELLVPHLHNETPLPLAELAEEYADIDIRVGDITHGLDIDRDATVAAKIGKNTQRPYGYGTPLAQEVRHAG